MGSQEQGPPRAPAAASQPISGLPVSAVYEALGMRAEGLTTAEVAARQARFGPNEIREVKSGSLIVKFLGNFTHLMAILLWAGGIIALHRPDAAAWHRHLGVNLINGAFSFWQEYKAERATAALSKLLPQYARVIRAGEELEPRAEELVPGDIMLLAEGDHISADGRLVGDAELRVDQSTLTGESHPARKTSEPICVTTWARWRCPTWSSRAPAWSPDLGRAVVFATGMNTEFGRVAGLTQSLSDTPSPLQIEMRRATKVVTLIAVSIGVAFYPLAVLIARIDPAAGFIFAMGMIVAFVPEGMLPMVTLALAMGVQRMARRHALIKRLSVVETLGLHHGDLHRQAGTLTQNETTACVRLPDQALTVTGPAMSRSRTDIVADARSVSLKSRRSQGR